MLENPEFGEIMEACNLE